MSAVPKGRMRWSSQWLMWGLVPAGLNISDKNWDFTLVCFCFFFLKIWLTKCAFPLQKRRNLPSLAVGVLACEGEYCIPVLTPSHQPTSRQASSSSSVASQMALLILSRHILGNLYLLKTALLSPKPDAAFQTITCSSHDLCCKMHSKRFKSMSGGSPNVTSVWEAGSWILFVLWQRASLISVGCFDLAFRWCASEKELWLVHCCFELEGEMVRSLH